MPTTHAHLSFSFKQTSNHKSSVNSRTMLEWYRQDVGALSQHDLKEDKGNPSCQLRALDRHPQILSTRSATGNLGDSVLSNRPRTACLNAPLYWLAPRIYFPSFCGLLPFEPPLFLLSLLFVLSGCGISPSFFRPTPATMSMSISIHPVSSYLDMYGEADESSAYSLSGVVTISVSSPYSLFERRRTARLLLQSLSLTFEGQSEIFTQATGYTGMRLYSLTRELAPSEPIEFTNEGHEDSDPCQWDIVFNLPIPGWLPGSTSLGMDEIGIKYGLYATAKFINLDAEQNPSSWSFATLCAPFRSRIRSVESSKKITIRRYVLPPHVDDPPSTINYLVNSHSSPEKAETLKKRIPAEVLSKIQVLASVPDCVNVGDNTVPVTVRLRTKDLEAAECKRLQITEVCINILQEERCRYRPSATFLSRFPVPPREMQPPALPLRDPNPLSCIYDVGLYLGTGHSESICRTFSLLPKHEAGKYKLAENNYAFATDGEQGDNPTWYTMETRIPFVQADSVNPDPETEEWAGPAVIRPSSSSPLYTVSHDVSISLTFSYDLPGSDERARERLNFNIPITFGQYLPSFSVEGALKPPGEAETDCQVHSLETPRPASPFSNLPSYAQLYDSNGEPKVDLSVPLPLYTPRGETAPAENGREVPIPAYTEVEKPAASFISGMGNPTLLTSST